MSRFSEGDKISALRVFENGYPYLYTHAQMNVNSTHKFVQDLESKVPSKESFLNFHIQISVTFPESSSLILFHFHNDVLHRLHSVV